jgi:hypothetical protein
MAKSHDDNDPARENSGLQDNTQCSAKDGFPEHYFHSRHGQKLKHDEKRRVIIMRLKELGRSAS